MKTLPWLLAAACLVPCAGQAAPPATAVGTQAESMNMRLVGYSDLQARTAYQPTIQKQGNRWIAYVGLAIILYVALDMIWRGILELYPVVT